MAFTLDQYNALEAAISQGAKRVKYADKEVEYNSMTEMLQLLGLMKDQLGLTDNNGSGNNRKVVTSYKSGIHGCNNNDKW